MSSIKNGFIAVKHNQILWRLFMKKRMTIAFFFHDANIYSGATMALMDLIEFYLKNEPLLGIIAVFPVKEGDAIDKLKKKGITVVSSHYSNITRKISESKKERIFRYPKRKKIYIRNFLWNYFIVSYKLEKYKIDAIYSNTSVILAPGVIAKRLNVPIIAHFREFGEEDYGITPWFGRKKYYNIVNNYDKIICISQAIYNKYSRNISKDKLIIIYDDLSAKYDNFSSKVNADLKHFNILIAGNITVGKAQLMVLEKLKDLLQSNSNMYLYIAGGITDQEYFNKLMDFIQRNNLSNKVIYLGLVENMNDLRKKMHVGIVASEKEGFGRVTIEGMLSGMIMLGRDLGGTSELIQDGINGVLIDSTLDDLSKKLEYVYENYSNLDDIRNNAYQYGKKFISGECAKKVLNEFYKLQSEK